MQGLLVFIYRFGGEHPLKGAPGDESSFDDIVNTVKCFNYKDLEQQLHSLFSSKRLPQSEYFRLDYDDLIVVQQIMISRAET